MDYQEILVAAAVRKRVGEIWAAQRKSYLDSVAHHGVSGKTLVDQWEKENTMGKFIKPAYEELAWIAAQIREFRIDAELDARIAAETETPPE